MRKYVSLSVGTVIYSVLRVGYIFSLLPNGLCVALAVTLAVTGPCQYVVLRINNTGWMSLQRLRIHTWSLALCRGIYKVKTRIDTASQQMLYFIIHVRSIAATVVEQRG